VVKENEKELVKEIKGEGCCYLHEKGEEMAAA
jgi:hypothetical protein